MEYTDTIFGITPPVLTQKLALPREFGKIFGYHRPQYLSCDLELIQGQQVANRRGEKR